jgi:hypothetical protein
MNQQVNSKALIFMLGTGVLFCLIMIFIVATGFEIDLNGAIEDGVEKELMSVFRSSGK